MSAESGLQRLQLLECMRRIESESEQMTPLLKVCHLRNFLCLSIFVLTIVLVIPIRGIDHDIDDKNEKLIDFMKTPTNQNG